MKILTVTSSIDPAINQLVQSPYFRAFLFIILFDIFTGLCKGVYTKQLDSSVGLKGMIKHTIIITMVIALCLYLPALGYRDGARIIIVFYIAQYGLSIIENLGQMGIPIPAYIKMNVKKLSDEGNRTGGQERK